MTECYQSTGINAADLPFIRYFPSVLELSLLTSHSEQELEKIKETGEQQQTCDSALILKLQKRKNGHSFSFYAIPLCPLNNNAMRYERKSLNSRLEKVLRSAHRVTRQRATSFP